MSKEAQIGMKKVLHEGFEQVLARVPAALKSEGFGVLTEIDVRKTLKEKLDVDFRPYRILGACNPPLAHRALSTTLEVGMLLPCNVVVYAEDEGRTVVSAIDPTETIAARGEPALQDIAQEVRARLVRVLDRL